MLIAIITNGKVHFKLQLSRFIHCSFSKVFQKPLTVLYIIVKYLAHLSILNFYLDVLFEVFPRQSVRYALVDIVERLLEYSGSHILLFLVLV